MTHKLSTKLLSMLLVVVMLVSMIPLSAIPTLAYSYNEIPENMLDNSILRALACAGIQPLSLNTSYTY